jgi:serine/threonine-protein kinase RIO1
MFGNASVKRVIYRTTTEESKKVARKKRIENRVQIIDGSRKWLVFVYNHKSIKKLQKLQKLCVFVLLCAFCG